MINKYNRQRIGEKHIINTGQELLIVDSGTKPNYCIVQIGDWISEVKYHSITLGKVKYPYSPDLYGIAYLGVGPHKPKDNPKMHRTWVNMIARGYDEKTKLQSPVYRTTTVCKEWLNYQTFANWYTANYRPNWEIDKDLLIPGNKHYSPETCVFIPQELNKFLANAYSSNRSGHTGVVWNKINKTWTARIMDNGINTNLGSFKDIKLASEAYSIARTALADKQRELYKNIIPSSVLKAIR
jgi:hypothetical protein